MPFSRGSSQPGDQIHISYICLHWQAGSLPLIHQESPSKLYDVSKGDKYCGKQWGRIGGMAVGMGGHCSGHESAH